MHNFEQNNKKKPLNFYFNFIHNRFIIINDKVIFKLIFIFKKKKMPPQLLIKDSKQVYI